MTQQTNATVSRKPNRKLAFLLLAMVAIAVSATSKSAHCQGISISNFQLTGTSVSFSISGSFPSSVPADSRNTLFFVNPNVFASPGFALVGLSYSSSSVFSGTQALRSSPPPVATGNLTFGDNFFVSFQNQFSAAEAINGNFNAAWSQTVFAPDRVGSLNVFWGTASSPVSVATGTLLTSVPVPEPSTYAMALAGLACGGFSMWRRRKRA